MPTDENNGSPTPNPQQQRAFDTMFAGFSSLGKNVLNSSTSLADWGDALKDTTRGLASLLPGSAGQVVQNFTNATTGAAAGLLNMAEVGAKNFQSLSRSGFIFGDGLKGATTAALNAGVAFDSFAKFVESNGDKIRNFYSETGLAGDALQAFTDASRSFRTTQIGATGEMTNYAEGLRRLGYENEEINETLANFATLNRVAYLESSKTDATRNAAAYRFAIEMDRMAQLTGQSRKELQKKMEEDRRNGRVQAFLRGLSADQQKAFLEGQQAAAAAGPLAKRAFEDMMMQGSLTAESSNAAAIYGQDFLNMLQTQREQFRNINSEGDVVNFRTTLADMQGIAIDALSSERNRSIAILGSNSDYIRSLQGEFQGQGRLYDQTLGLMRDGLTAREARLKVLQEFSDRLDQLGVTTGGSGEGGPDPDRGDPMTNAYTALTTAIDQVNTALKDKLVAGLNDPQIQNSLRNAATGIRDAAGNRTAGTGLLGAIDNLTEGIDEIWTAFTGQQTPGSGQMTPEQTAETARILDEEDADQGNRFFGGMMRANLPGLVGDGPNGQVLPTSEVITPNMNSLVVTMGQMATKMRETIGPQMQAMAEQMRPQMEQMANQLRPQMEQMANQMRPQMESMAPQIETYIGELNTKFERLLDAYRENTRAVNKAGRNTYRI